MTNSSGIIAGVEINYTRVYTIGVRQLKKIYVYSMFAGVRVP